MRYAEVVAAVGVEGVRRIKKTFTIVTVGHNNTRKKVCVCRVVKGEGGVAYLVVPRFGGFMLQRAGIYKGVIENRLGAGEEVVFAGRVGGLTENQGRVLDHLGATV